MAVSDRFDRTPLGRMRKETAVPFACQAMLPPKVALRRSAGSPQESTGVHSGVDRLDADGTRVLGQESTNPPILSQLKNTPIQAPEREQAQHDHHHARNTARSRAEHLLRAMAGRKSRRLRTSNRRPLPVISSLRAPESGAFDVPERDFPGNRPLPRWKFLCVD